MKKNTRILSVLLVGLFLLGVVPVRAVPVQAAETGHTIVLQSTQNSDGTYSHTALYDGTAVKEYDYTWHADPSTVHNEVSNSPAEYYTGTKPGNDAVYIAHDIYYYPELDTSRFTRINYDGEQEWVYYYTASGYTNYIFSTLPGRGSLPTQMMHSAEEAYRNAVLHITQPGTYTIEGDWHGQIWVDLENYCDDPFTDPTAKVELVLNGVNINCTVAAGVVFKNVYECDNTWEDKSSWSHKVDTSEAGAVVTLADGTVNNVSGTNIFRILKTQYKSGSSSVQKKRLKIDGAFYSYQSLNIQGQRQGTGVLNITAGFEGLDSELHLTILGGNVNISSQDDGINVNEDGVSVLSINGGNLHILAGLGSEGDGIDSNGYITVYGGTTISMANPGSDSGMDSDFGTYVFGGNVVALGSTMDWAKNDSSVSYTHAAMNLQFSSSKSAGDSIVITDTAGNGIFAYDPDKDEIAGTRIRTYTGAIVSCDDFEIGQSYRVYIGGDVNGTETMGVYDMSTVTAVTGTYQQSYSGTSVGGGPGGRPGSSSGSTGSNTTFTLSTNVNAFSGVGNYGSSETVSVIPQAPTHTHNYHGVVTEPSCEEKGFTTYTCECGDTYDADFVDALGHSYGSFTTVKEPDCDTDGSMERSCSVCGDVEEAAIPALGHSYGTESLEGTCQSHPGIRYTCGVCGHSYDVYDDELYTQWSEIKPTGIDEKLIQTKTEYRYRDQITVTSAENVMEGYELVGTGWDEGVAGALSYAPNITSTGFSAADALYAQYTQQKVTAFETDAQKRVIDSDKRTGYLYYHWCYAGSYYSVESRSNSYTTFHAYFDTTDPGSFRCDTSDMSYCTAHSTCSNSEWFFVTEVYTQSYTTYNKVYTHAKWGDWTPWQTDAVEGSDSRQVECRTLYRYVDAPYGDHSFENGVCTVCGTAAPSTVTLTGTGFTLSFEDEILVNFYYTVSDPADVAQQGMLVFFNDPGAADVAKADDVYTGSSYVEASGTYINTTLGIAAKEMGDSRYYCAYARLTDGSYVYSPLYQYCPRKYAMNMIGRSTTSDAQKALCVAMLNYGAAAQEYFGYRTDDLMNAELTAAQKALVADYDASLFAGAVPADGAKVGVFAPTATGFSGKSASVSFEGAFAINYYFAPGDPVDSTVTLYYWTAQDYAAAEILKPANATGKLTMSEDGGIYWGQISGIAAKALDDTFYVAAAYTSDTQIRCTGVIAYSLSKYCMNNASGDMGALAQATAMYGYYAKAYFAN